MAYLRVSTDEQADSGLGLAAQARAVEELAARLSLEVVATFTDEGVSGAKSLEGRPELLAAVDALGKGDALLVAKRDRLGRDVILVAMLERLVERKGARVVSAAGEGTEQDGASGLLMRRIVDAFAEYERALIGERTKAALAAKRSRGERAGSIPFGQRLAANGVSLEEDAGEQAAIAAVHELRAAGLSHRKVAAEMTHRGFRTRRGGRFQATQVARIIRAAA